jgi:hypothetical protein
MKNGIENKNKNENKNEGLEFGVGETPVETPFMASEVRKFVKESEDEGLHSR